MKNFYNSIGLVGSGTASSGCGILGYIKGRKCIITCNHILDELKNEPSWFQFDIMKTFYPIGGFLRYQFNIVQRFDFADSALLQTGQIQGGEYLSFDTNHLLTPGDLVHGFGYPVTETNKELSQGKNEPFIPIKVSGVFEGYYPQLPLGNGVNDNKIIVYNVGVIKTNRNDFAGFSGGLITTDDDRPIGLIVGQNDFRLLFVSIVDFQDLLSS